MYEVTLKDLKQMALDAKDNIWGTARAYDREPKIYLHWSAGKYDTKFGDYHINITGKGAVFVSTDNLGDILSHTYHRNSGAIGVSLDCAYEADTNSLGSYPPTKAQIEKIAKVGCILCDALDLTIDINRVMTHGEAADNEDGLEPHDAYGPKTTCERWDLEYLGTNESPSFNPWATDGSRGGDVLRGKMNWYRTNGIVELK
jgi:hypothetical protein